ncbi:hypothetical protein DY000_02021130 [Brassica cretica]|uniref:Uncharacterized protein n=1 Tax=Brassica cretica TaxID=69181 RepID=A0ABQ7EJC1_BRACR|nr:hypothetical protein DY000_02021130 [Brassica cretica]
MNCDSRRSDYSMVEFVFLAPQVFPYIRFVIGSEYFADLAAWYLIGWLSPASGGGGVARFLPCSLVSFSGVNSVFCEFPFGLIQSINDGPISDLLDDSRLELRFGQGSRFDLELRSLFEVPIGGIRCVWVVSAVPSAPVGPAGKVSVLESDPIGSKSLILDGVVPMV